MIIRTPNDENVMDIHCMLLSEIGFLLLLLLFLHALNIRFLVIGANACLPILKVHFEQDLLDVDRYNHIDPGSRESNHVRAVTFGI